MNRNIIIFLLGLIGIFTACEKDGDQVVMNDNVVAPSIVTMPNLNLERANGANTITFIGTAVDPGFEASATYYLEACPTGDDFENSVLIYSGSSIESIELKESTINQILLKGFPEDQTTTVDFRVRSVLTVDGGTGAAGTGDNLFEYISEIKTVDITIYGLLRLDLIGSGIDQKVVSPSSDGIYTNYVKLDPLQAFSLFDPESNTTYGATGSNLVVDGTAIAAPGDPGAGWYNLSADINALTFTMDSYMVGLVGAATPNGWDAPDSKMDYNLKEDCWTITVDLVDDQFKFRMNDGWAWNLGGNGTADGSADNYSADGMTVALSQGGRNIPLLHGAGNYTIKLFITESKAVIVKN